MPGYKKLNGVGFATDVRIVGDNGKCVSLGQPASAGLASMIAICRNIIMPGSVNDIENSTGIMINSFPMNNGMCYNVMRVDESICIGHSSIEGLVEMEHFLKSYINNIKIKDTEDAFLDFLKHKDVEKMLENPTLDDIDLHINFADFVQVCMELKGEEEESNDVCGNEDQQPQTKKIRKSANQSKTQ